MLYYINYETGRQIHLSPTSNILSPDEKASGKTAFRAIRLNKEASTGRRSRDFCINLLRVDRIHEALLEIHDDLS